MNCFTALSMLALSISSSPASTASITRRRAIVSATCSVLNHTRPLRPMAVSNEMCAASAGNRGCFGLRSLLSVMADLLHLLSAELQRALHHKSSLELAEALSLPRSRIDALDFRLHVAIRNRHTRIDQCSDLIISRMESKRIAHLEVRFAPLRCAFESQGVQASHMRASQVYSISFGVSGNDGTENEITLSGNVSF